MPFFNKQGWDRRAGLHHVLNIISIFLEQLAISKISNLNMQPYLTFWDQKIYLYGQVMLFIAEDNTVNFTVGTLS